MIRKTIAAGLLATLAAPTATFAFENTGTDVSLSFGQVTSDDFSDDNIRTRELQATSSYAFGNGFGVGVLAFVGRLTDSDGDYVQQQVLGIEPTYQLGAISSAGGLFGFYFERHSFSVSTSSETEQVNNSGIAGSFDVASNATVSVFAGRYTSSTIDSLGSNMSTGLRVDLDVNDRIGGYVSIMRDTFSDSDSTIGRNAIGASYTFGGMMSSAAVAVSAELARYDYDGTDIQEASIGVSMPLGAVGSSQYTSRGVKGALANLFLAD